MTIFSGAGGPGFIQPRPTLPVGSQGGGSPGGGGSSSPSPINLSQLPVTGGLSGTVSAFLMIGFDAVANQNLTYLVDPTNFNCEETSEYDFRIEEVEPGNVLTIHNIVIRYRDLGIATFTVNIQNAVKGILASKPFTVGNQIPTNKIFTKKCDMQATGEALQITITQAANAGPRCITKVRAWGSYGDGDII